MLGHAINSDSFYTASTQRLLARLLACLVLVSGAQSWAARAGLPTANEVRPSKALKLDGEYRISTLNKRILVDRGRAIALEGWKHLFLWDIEPGMVVIRDINYAGNGLYTGQDLPLKGAWEARLNDHDNSFSAVVTTSLGPVRYELIPVGATDTEEEAGGEHQEPTNQRVAANRMGNAKIPTIRSCPGKQSYLSRGACWKCPNGYKRAKLTREMDHPEACQRRGFGSKDHPSARRLSDKRARCPATQFHVAESGVNGCYRCPPGSRRDTSIRNSTMCLSQR